MPERTLWRRHPAFVAVLLNKRKSRSDAFHATSPFSVVTFTLEDFT